jgi:Holliday junction resolvase RusA-like endonuclease
MTYRFALEMKLLNKSNKYRIHVNRRTGARFPAPTQECKNEQAAIAAAAAEVLPLLLDQDLGLRITLLNQRCDVDGVKSVLDGIQQSGRIKNDRQFRELLVRHEQSEGAPGIECEVYRLRAGRQRSA